MRRSLAPFTAAEPLVHTRSLADFITTTSEFRFSVQTRYRNHRTDGWEYVDLDNNITDYGTADWKGRQLEMVFTDVSITMKNRILGEYKKLCFSLALIFDEEFKMLRDPLEEFNPDCNQASDPTRTWKQARGFKSQWLAE
jgi:hypothetical protein